MKEVLITSLSSAYAVVGLLGLLAYMPTIFDLFRGKGTVNAWTYSFWLVASLVAALYFLIVIEDIAMPVIYGTHVMACGIILLLHYMDKNRSRIVLSNTELDM